MAGKKCRSRAKRVSNGLVAQAMQQVRNQAGESHKAWLASRPEKLDHATMSASVDNEASDACSTMYGTTHTLRVTLLDTAPAVWRLVEVSSDMTLAEVSDALEEVMGWDGYHLHEFDIRGDLYRRPSSHYDWDNSDWGGKPKRDETQYKIGYLLPRNRMVMKWWYDFGDDWHHHKFRCRPIRAFSAVTAAAKARVLGLAVAQDAVATQIHQIA